MSRFRTSVTPNGPHLAKTAATTCRGIRVGTGRGMAYKHAKAYRRAFASV